MALFNSCRHCGSHFQSLVSFHKVVIREIESNRSFKVFKLFAESIGQTSQAAAMHPQRVILLFNVGRVNPQYKLSV